MDSSFNSQFQNIAQFTLDMIFPRYCYVCHKERTWLCPACQKATVPITNNSCFLCQKLTPMGICRSCRQKIPLTGCFSAGFYHNPILKNMIHDFKYKFVSDLKYPLVDLLQQTLTNSPISPKNSALVPIPLHPARQNERGFNQSALLSEIISDRLNIPNLKLLKRIKPTAAQATLKPAKRPENIKNAFKINQKIQIDAKNIILVDDVITTGATIGECARVLRAAGFKRIFALTIARG